MRCIYPFPRLIVSAREFQLLPSRAIDESSVDSGVRVSTLISSADAKLDAASGPTASTKITGADRPPIADQSHTYCTVYRHTRVSYHPPRVELRGIMRHTTGLSPSFHTARQRTPIAHHSTEAAHAAAERMIRPMLMRALARPHRRTYAGGTLTLFALQTYAPCSWSGATPRASTMGATASLVEANWVALATGAFPHHRSQLLLVVEAALVAPVAGAKRQLTSWLLLDGDALASTDRHRRRGRRLALLNRWRW